MQGRHRASTANSRSWRTPEMKGPASIVGRVVFRNTLRYVFTAGQVLEGSRQPFDRERRPLRRHLSETRWHVRLRRVPARSRRRWTVDARRLLLGTRIRLRTGSPGRCPIMCCLAWPRSRRTDVTPRGQCSDEICSDHRDTDRDAGLRRLRMQEGEGPRVPTWSEPWGALPLPIWRRSRCP